VDSYFNGDILSSKTYIMHVIDLTMRISSSIRVFPGSPQPCFIKWSKLDIQGYDSEVMFMSTHTGTHVDAPSHFKPDLASIDMISVARLVCNAVLIRTERHAGQLVEQQDLSNLEIMQGDAVVIATGWEKHAANRNYMTENPGLSRQAARYLAKKKVNAVAIDCPSIDAGTDSRFTVHNLLLQNDIIIVENLCNLDRIANRNKSSNKFTLIISPLKLLGATGSPARVLAQV
jgi:arylformamidase